MSNNMGCGVGDEGAYPVAEYPASVIDSLKVFIINPLGLGQYIIGHSLDCEVDDLPRQRWYYRQSVVVDLVSIPV